MINHSIFYILYCGIVIISLKHVLQCALQIIIHVLIFFSTNFINLSILTSFSGISDYQDGSRGKEWQPYASLVAAAVMKALVCAMDPPASD